MTGMSEETYNSLSSVVSTAASAIIMMGASNPRAWSDVKNNQNTIQEVLQQGRNDITKVFARTPNVVNTETYSTWVDMKAGHKGTVTTYVKENKPLGSPVPKDWLDNGGSIKIETLDNGAQIWTYTSQSGVSVSYIGGQSSHSGYVTFPQQYLHPNPNIATFNIGKFTTREADKAAALEYLKKMGYDGIPSGYVLHHDVVNGTVQLVKESVHSLFSHYGGVFFNK